MIIFVGWKIVKHTSIVKPEDMDFRTGLAEVEAHEAALVIKPPATRYER